MDYEVRKIGLFIELPSAKKLDEQFLAPKRGYVLKHSRVRTNAQLHEIIKTSDAAYIP